MHVCICEVCHVTVVVWKADLNTFALTSVCSVCTWHVREILSRHCLSDYCTCNNIHMHRDTHKHTYAHAYTAHLTCAGDRGISWDCLADHSTSNNIHKHARTRIPILTHTGTHTLEQLTWHVQELSAHHEISMVMEVAEIYGGTNLSMVVCMYICINTYFPVLGCAKQLSYRRAHMYMHICIHVYIFFYVRDRHDVLFSYFVMSQERWAADSRRHTHVYAGCECMYTFYVYQTGHKYLSLILGCSKATQLLNARPIPRLHCEACLHERALD